MSQTTFDWNVVNDKETEERPFVTFDDAGEVIVKFEDNDPFWNGVPKESKYNSHTYMFKVQGMIEGEAVPAIFSTSSKRCMQALASLRPLKNKSVIISRTGEGIDTQYRAKKI